MSTSLVKKVCKRVLNGTFKWKSAGIAIFMAFLMLSSVFIVFSNPAASTVKAQTTTSPTTSVSQTPWPMFGYDVGRDRDNKNSTAPSTGHMLWKAQTGGAVDSSPAVNYGMVYVGSNDGSVYAFDEQTGALIWKYQTGGIVYSSPAVVNNMVYVGSENGNVYCLNAATGALIWSYTTGSLVYSSPLVVNGEVYIGSDDTYLYCLNAATGALTWKFGPTEGSIMSTPSYAGGYVFFGTSGGTLDTNYPGFAQNNWSYFYQVDATTGAQIWKFEISYFLMGSPAISDYDVFFGVDSIRYANIYGINWLTQQVMFARKIGAQCDSSPAVSAGQCYFGGTDWYLWDISGQEGFSVWDTKTEGEIYSSPAVADGMVYVGGTDDWFYCFNATEGNMMWRMQTGGPIMSSPAIADGNIYVGSGDGCLYCFGYGSPTTTTTYPWAEGGSGFTCYSQSPGPTTPNLLWVAQVGYVVPLDRTFEAQPTLTPEVTQWQSQGSPTSTVSTLPATSRIGMGDMVSWDTCPIVSNGTVYDSGWGTYAFDALTGKPIWHNPANGDTWSSSILTYYDGVVSDPTDGMAFNATNGQVLYTSAYPAAQGCVVYDGNVYGGTMTLAVTLQINDTTGAIIRTYIPGVSPNFVGLPIVNGVMYGCVPFLTAANGTFNVQGISLATGQTVFTSESYPENWAFQGFQEIVADGKFFFGLAPPFTGVSAVDLTTGKILWNSHTDGTLEGEAYANGIIYSDCCSGTLWAMNATTGQTIWQLCTAGGSGSLSPAISSNGLIYYGSMDGCVYCLNAATGALVWKYQTRGSIGSSIAIADGVVYAASADGFLYAFADNQSLAAAGVSQRVYGPSVAADASQSSTTPSTTALSQTVATNPINPASPASASWPITAYVAVAALAVVAVVATVVAATVVLRRSKRK